jgi:hypothetical protein
MVCFGFLTYRYDKIRAGHRQRKHLATKDTGNQQPRADNRGTKQPATNTNQWQRHRTLYRESFRCPEHCSSAKSPSVQPNIHKCLKYFPRKLESGSNEHIQTHTLRNAQLVTIGTNKQILKARNRGPVSAKLFLSFFQIKMTLFVNLFHRLLLLVYRKDVLGGGHFDPNVLTV